MLICCPPLRGFVSRNQNQICTYNQGLNPRPRLEKYINNHKFSLMQRTNITAQIPPALHDVEVNPDDGADDQTERSDWSRECEVAD